MLRFQKYAKTLIIKKSICALLQYSLLGGKVWQASKVISGNIGESQTEVGRWARARVNEME